MIPREGRKERKEEKTHTDSVCVCGATERVRPVKERAVIKGEMSRWRRQGGDTGKSGRYSQSHKTCVHIATLLFCALSLWKCFYFHDLFPLFTLQMHAHTHTPTHKQTAPPFIPALHLPGRGSSAAINDVVTLRLTALPCYVDHRTVILKKTSSDVADAIPPSCITSFAGLAELMNRHRWRRKRGKSRKV